MSYSTSNPPYLVIGTVGSLGGQVWAYSSDDASTDVDLSGYITNGGALGMRKGDIVLVTDANASAGSIVTVHGVDSVSTTYPGAVNLTNAYAATNSD
jgi:hypothetical protein